MSLTDGNIIEIDNLSFKYARQNKYILKNLTLNIKDGQWIALIGHNGSGKSTLARLIDGLLKAESGSIKVDGYESRERNNKQNMKNLNINIKDGQWISLIGHNGSGKSTLARLIDGLLKAESGSIKVDGYEMNEKNIWDIRKKIGMVFQNPDNQFVGADV